MKPAAEWLNEVGETVANSMLGWRPPGSDGSQPPGHDVEQLIKRIQEDATEADGVSRLKQTLAAIESGIKNEFSDGKSTMSDDLLDNFQEFVRHHKEVETERNVLRNRVAVLRTTLEDILIICQK